MLHLYYLSIKTFGLERHYI